MLFKLDCDYVLPYHLIPNEESLLEEWESDVMSNVAEFMVEDFPSISFIKTIQENEKFFFFVNLNEGEVEDYILRKKKFIESSIDGEQIIGERDEWQYISPNTWDELNINTPIDELEPDNNKHIQDIFLYYLTLRLEGYDGWGEICNIPISG